MQCVAVCVAVCVAACVAYKDSIPMTLLDVNTVCCSVLQCVLQCVAACVAYKPSIVIFMAYLLACLTSQACMGWLPSVGSLKSQVSFAKEPYKLDDILQKRPTILRSLLIVAKQETCNFKASYASPHSIHLSCSSDTFLSIGCAETETYGVATASRID